MKDFPSGDTPASFAGTNLDVSPLAAPLHDANH
jgi:hypothetical protein